MKATNWTHLPVAGGWYDQHPEFVDSMMFLLQKEAEAERAKRAKEKRAGRNRSNPSMGSRKPRGRR